MHGDKKFIQNIRRDYIKGDLLEKNTAGNPVDQFRVWFNEAIESRLVDGNSMTLCTVSGKRPSARVVLLKSFDESGFVFYTNYGSQKSKEIESSPEGCLLFYWAEFERQIRINGIIQKVSRQESADYFATRPRDSQIGAWASSQSELLSRREELELLFEKIKKKYEGLEVPIPPFWGGYILVPDHFEFWQGRPNRLHDRIVYERNRETWDKKRLFP
ncbi:MAG: pyridoxamine 5'-phosphate oxidase [Spirochaetia bacterium]|nr:pyridoxamine 5'-phosphate oxidase [Spirochaetia bacterium]